MNPQPNELQQLLNDEKYLLADIAELEAMISDTHEQLKNVRYNIELEKNKIVT
jgi:hypothetical protein